MFKRIARVVARVVNKMVQIAEGTAVNRYEEILLRCARDLAREFGAMA